MHVDLSGGESAELIPLAEIRHRKIVVWKKFVGAKLSGVDDGDYESKAEANEEYKAFVIAGLTRSWTLTSEDEKPLAITAENVLDLFAVDFAALVTAADPVLRLVAGQPVDPKSLPSSGG